MIDTTRVIQMMEKQFWGFRDLAISDSRRMQATLRGVATYLELEGHTAAAGLLYTQSLSVEKPTPEPASTTK